MTISSGNPAEPPTYFEGPEKKVEIAVVGDHPPLRSMNPSWWHEVVAAAGAQVLSKLESDVCDAYLLSESSLFVWDDHLTLITCGQTRLVDAVAMVLRQIPPKQIASLIYERKNEHFPERQPTSFREDASRLATWLPGRALRFGEEHDHCVHVFHTTAEHLPRSDDTTLEVLMHGLPEDRLRCFRPGSTRVDPVDLGNLLPGFRVDEHAFTPAGYSLNALRDHEYYTIHVTPERIGSYVSFETNVDVRGDSQDLISRVLHIFRPRSVDIVAFTPAAGSSPGFELPDYRIKDDVKGIAAGYEVRFLHCYRPAARASEPFVYTL